MKYIAVLDTDDFEDFDFFEDGKEKYLHAIDATSENGEWIYLPFRPLEQEPILDKIREQMKDYLRGVEITLEVLVENDPLRPKMEGAKDTLEECLELIDKAESEDT